MPHSNPNPGPDPDNRIVPSFAFEGGDIEFGNGDGGESIYGDGWQTLTIILTLTILIIIRIGDVCA